jgi:hypothetical protein
MDLGAERRSRNGLSLLGLTIFALTASACQTVPPTDEGPRRKFASEDELAGFRLKSTSDIWDAYLGQSPAVRTGLRNELVSARMYAIDVNYGEYEHGLNVEGQSVEFWARIAKGTMAGVASVTTVDSTVKALNAAINGTDVALGTYNDTFFRKQLIQNLMTAMRAARHERRAIIRTRMQCPANIYPLGLALSDVESYYRAGTIESGLIRLNRTVSSDERKAKGSDDVSGATASPEAKNAEKNAKAAMETADATKADKAGSSCSPATIASIRSDGVSGADYSYRPLASRYAASKTQPASTDTQYVTAPNEAANASPSRAEGSVKSIQQ